MVFEFLSLQLEPGLSAEAWLTIGYAGVLLLAVQLTWAVDRLLGPPLANGWQVGTAFIAGLALLFVLVMVLERGWSAIVLSDAIAHGLVPALIPLAVGIVMTMHHAEQERTSDHERARFDVDVFS